MSRRALLLAVRDVLRRASPEGLGLSPRECELTLPGGQPPPRAGKWFVGVWPGGQRSMHRNAFDTEYDVTVTVTARVNEPYDRIATDLLAAVELGFYDRVERIEKLIHKDSWNFIVGRVANQILADPLTSDEPTGFRQGLTFRDDTVPRLVGGDWFHADPEADEIGIVQDLHFGGARRVQNLVNVGV